MGKILKKEILESILEDYKNGVGIEDLEQKYGFKRQTIRNHLRKVGDVYKPRARRFSDEEVEGIIEDYRNGVPIKEIGKKYNRDGGSIIGKLKSLGIHERKVYKYTDDDIEFLKKYYPLRRWDLIEERFPNFKKNKISSKMSSLGISCDKFYEDSRWTDDELDILRDNYLDSTKEEITELLPKRTYESIHAMALKLELKVRSLWSDDEIKILKDNYHHKTPDEISKMLPGRSRNSVILKANNLKLVSYINFTDEETDFLVNNWENMSDDELAEKLSKNARSIKTKRQSMRLLRVKDGSCYNYLSEYIRRNNIDWKVRSMRSCGYKCVLSGGRFDAIHHLHGLNMILNETIEQFDLNVKDNMDDYSEDELHEILERFKEVQDTYPLGVCLSTPIHKLFHDTYGYGNNTEEQWNEFVEKYQNGDFAVVA